MDNLSIFFLSVGLILLALGVVKAKITVVLEPRNLVLGGIVLCLLGIAWELIPRAF